MNLPPNYVGRTPDRIVSETNYFDSAGYLFRAMSWLSFAETHDEWPPLMYACIEGRYGLEYLLFEEAVVSTGANLSLTEYKKCLEDPTKIHKLIERITPDHARLQQFTRALVSLAPEVPPVIFWNPKEIMRAWGNLSQYLHWCGHRLETAEDRDWRRRATEAVKTTLSPIWERLTSGPSAMMHPKDMHPEIREIWEDFRSGKIDIDGAKIRINILKPLLSARYA